MAAFNPIIYGRFWVITEGCRSESEYSRTGRTKSKGCSSAARRSISDMADGRALCCLHPTVASDCGSCSCRAGI